jgi:hypothetical protein
MMTTEEYRKELEEKDLVDLIGEDVMEERRQ